MQIECHRGQVQGIMGACGRAVNLVKSGVASGYTKTKKEYSNFSEACILWTVLQTGLQIIIESNFLMFCIFSSAENSAITSYLYSPN